MATYQVGNVEVALKTQMDEATKKATSLISSLEKIKSSVNKTGKQIKSTGKEIKTVDAQASKLGKSLKTAFSVGSLYVALNYARRYATSLANLVKSSVDFVETQNKFKVSMGSMYQEAMNFQNKINETLGLSTSQLMDFQANFNNIIKGLGTIDQQTAYNMSESLTQMAIDFASLFNVSLESSMSKFQAALTQQVRPIRSVSGFDITQQTLGSVLNQIGVTDRTVSDLSQVEKRLVIIIALQKQMANVGAMGDFARTIEQPANQLKVLEQTLIDVGIAVGNFVLAYVAPALAYINGFLMAMKTLLQGLVSFFGMDSADTPTIDDYLQTDDAISGVEDTTQAVKDLKKATTGIDELNIINQQEDSGDSGTGGGLGSVDPRILSAIEDYSSVLDDVKMKATTIRDRILEWLGYTGDWGTTLANSDSNLSKIITALKIAAGVITGISVAAAGISFANTLSEIMTGTSLLTRMLDSISSVKSVQSLTGTSFSSKIGQVIALHHEGAGTLSESLQLVFPWTKKVSSGFSSITKSITGMSTKTKIIIAVIAALVAGFIYLWNTNEDFRNSIIEIWDNIQPIFEQIGEVFKQSLEQITPILQQLMPILQEIVTNILTAFGEVAGDIVKTLGKLVEAVLPVILELIQTLLPVITDIIVAILPVFLSLLDAINPILEMLMQLLQPILDLFIALLDPILDIIMTALQPLIDIILMLVNSVIVPVLIPIIKQLAGIFTDVLGVAIEAIKPIIDQVIKILKSLIDFVSGVFSGDWDKAWGAIKDTVKNVLNLIPTFVESAINGVIGLLNKLLARLPDSALRLIGLSSGYQISKVTLPRFATGGFPTRGDYFLANENGSPEYVGSIGGRTAVANTNQIVQGISLGVSMANAETNNLNRQQIQLLQSILNKDTNTYLDGRKVSDQLKKSQAARGFNPVVGGFAYV